MITELLEATLTEMMDSSFEISEFQLGEGPYNILKSEAESLVTGYKVDISKVNLFKGIPVSLHPSKDAVMYCLKFKNKMNSSESRLKFQPKYKIGQVVKLKIKTEDNATGFSFENEVKGIISVIKASGTSQDDTYQYGITNDMPGCYRNGKPPFAFVFEDEIDLVP